MLKLWLLACLSVTSLVAAGDTVLVLPFSNLSKDSNLDWIGESLSESTREALASAGVLVLDRESRNEAYRRLAIKAYSPLTHASVLKAGEELDAAQVVHGEFEFRPSGAAPPASRGSLRIIVVIFDLNALKRGPTFEETGALEDLASLQVRVAWQALRYLSPDTAPSEEEFRRLRPPVRLDALESYIRGLLASAPEQKLRLFSQAVRLDARLSPAAFQLGLLYWEKKDYRLAAQWLAKVPPADARYREGEFFRGLCNYYLGDFAAAEAAFADVASAVPLNEVLNNLGAAQSRRGEPVAAETFRKALEGDPSDPDYHFNVGYALWKRGDYATAAESFRAVLDRNPEDQLAILLLGRCLKGSGPRANDPQAAGLERMKHSYEETAFRQLRAVLAPKKP